MIEDKTYIAALMEAPSTGEEPTLEERREEITHQVDAAMDDFAKALASLLHTFKRCVIRPIVRLFNSPEVRRFLARLTIVILLPRHTTPRTCSTRRRAVYQRRMQGCLQMN